MATKGSRAKTSRDTLISKYMFYVLENERSPGSIYKICKENNLPE